MLSEAEFAKASEAVRSTLSDERHSHVYLSPDALGRDGVKPYLNQVIRGYSMAGLEELSLSYKRIEADYGRNTMPSDMISVALDIDIVMADGCVLRQHDYESAHFTEGLCAL
ncbi:MAG: 2-amino-4-hydroxy-6-hydroxymethyldihydropteridine diphosphokinase [Muribaculaceae bacterium]|nr:2-amino-4-hydroxy-6-hydroxymethyldihydropteridine diphosphokinase [Muribaculaceae bacterium]